MSKVIIDIDKINESLIPLVNDAKDKISDAKDAALSVDFPNDEFDWSIMCTKLNDCLDMTNKYLTWLNSICSSYTESITTNIENIVDIKIDSISTSTIDVK